MTQSPLTRQIIIALAVNLLALAIINRVPAVRALIEGQP